MEHAVANAICETLPENAASCFMQPAPEMRPLDHAERCLKNGTDPDGWERADISVEIATTLFRSVIDVSTTNVVCASALKSSPEKYMTDREATKVKHYKDYYRNFNPLVIALSGGVQETSFAVLKRIARKASKTKGSYLEWEAYTWNVQMWRRIGICMAHVAAWVVGRTRSGESAHALASRLPRKLRGGARARARVVPIGGVRAPRRAPAPFSGVSPIPLLCPTNAPFPPVIAISAPCVAAMSICA